MNRFVGTFLRSVAIVDQSPPAPGLLNIVNLVREGADASLDQNPLVLSGTGGQALADQAVLISPVIAAVEIIGVNNLKTPK